MSHCGFLVDLTKKAIFGAVISEPSPRGNGTFGYCRLALYGLTCMTDDGRFGTADTSWATQALYSCANPTADADHSANPCVLTPIASLPRPQNRLEHCPLPGTHVPAPRI
jgi:hypothetical protein